MPEALRYNSDFKPITKGMFECPKCWGTTELCLTNRDADGWPIGRLKRMTCDWCDGEGEVREDKSEPPSAAPVHVEVVVAPSKWGTPILNEAHAQELAKATSIWGQTI